MGISVTHNADGSITVECGNEQLTFMPRISGGSDNDDSPEPIIPPDGPGPRVSVIVPIGDEAPGVERRSLPTIQWTNITQFSGQLRKMVASSGTASKKRASVVNVRIRPGIRLDLDRMLSSANRVARREDTLVQLQLINDLLKK